MSEKQWHDCVSESGIRWAKENRTPYKWLVGDDRKLIDKIIAAGDAVQRSRGNWQRIANTTWDPPEETIIRLREDWQRPEPEPEPEWLYREVRQQGNHWMVFDLPHRRCGNPRTLQKCVDMIGFGLVEYQEWPGEWLPIGTHVGRDGTPAYICDKEYPATPHRVRFHVATMRKHGVI